MSDDMNDKHKERLSAFVDNEIGLNALSELASGDPLLHRYQLIGDAIKGDLCDASLVDVSARVKVAIESELAHSADSIKVGQSRTSKKSSSAQPWIDFSAWLRPVGGMAVAASVAIVMVMVINQPETDEIGVSATGSQVAIDTRPVVSLPVSNVKNNLSNSINSGLVNIKNKDESEDDLDKGKSSNKIGTVKVYPQNNINQ